MTTENPSRGIYDQCYKGSSLVNINSKFDEYRNIIATSKFHKHYEHNDSSFITNASNVSEEMYELLNSHCSIDHLTVDGELNKMSKSSYEWCKDPADPSILDSIQLKTVKNTMRRNQLKNHQVHAKYRSEKPIIYKPSALPHSNGSLTPEKDILVFVRVYVPFTSRHKQSTGALGKLCLDSVIALYGSQTLDKLRDKIMCISDYSVSVDLSDAPVRKKTQNAKEVYKSGFFFIEDTFYNDCRDPNNKDNSQTIREWAESRNFGTYKVAKMEDTKIESLTLRFGFPWVYQHQGDCEHLISFSDARLVNATEELNKDCYPRIVRIKPRPNRYCMTCGIYSVTWVTTRNSRLPHNPCLFCDSCFKSYNYIKGTKIGSFQAFPYPYDNDLLQPNHAESMRMKPTTSVSQVKAKEAPSFKTEYLQMNFTD
ncbi:snRNA-activating protein complex subunit 3 isoform X1 [Nasonia vitripennis]|uniref:snRNA-activating protein complex subunit 3 n=2 Tax=Nasonia vitripennis TaxID=7425 RepID=A0A7M7GD22_NASVI|nr:snRNA-activating protein complex subunit 3 isoform X1 [Nasonia vitripennis]